MTTAVGADHLRYASVLQIEMVKSSAGVDGSVVGGGHDDDISGEGTFHGQTISFALTHWHLYKIEVNYFEWLLTTLEMTIRPILTHSVTTFSATALIAAFAPIANVFVFAFPPDGIEKLCHSGDSTVITVIVSSMQHMISHMIRYNHTVFLPVLKLKDAGNGL